MLTARVSPNGEWLAFMSQRSLTGYDNHDARTGQADEEVYEYGARSGTLSCSSCDPTGARPQGVEYGQLNTGEGGIAGGDSVWESSTMIAAMVPAWTHYTITNALYQSRYLDNSGRLFFTSSDALVARDVNSTEDVYEFEPEGVPAGAAACTSSSGSGSVAFRPAHGGVVAGVVVTESPGCVGLISSGISSQQSAFLDASETGSEVFVLTSAQLGREDKDTAADVYDARECSAASPCREETAALTPECDSEASCRPARSPSPELVGSGGSATVFGPGNLVTNVGPPKTVKKPPTRAQLLARALKRCRRDKRRKARAECERVARKRYGAHSKTHAGASKTGRSSKRAKR
jgi:hypothetical protein